MLSSYTMPNPSLPDALYLPRYWIAQSLSVSHERTSPQALHGSGCHPPGWGCTSHSPQRHGLTPLPPQGSSSWDAFQGNVQRLRDSPPLRENKCPGFYLGPYLALWRYIHLPPNTSHSGKPSCYLAVSGNTILKLPAPAHLSSHTEGVSAPNSTLKTLIAKHLGKLLKSFPIIFSFLIFQIFIHLYLFS